MASSTTAPPVESRCGLIGAFPGDAATLATLADMRARLLSGSGAPVTTAEIRGLLSALPWSGRVEFCAKSLYPSGASALVQQRNSALIVQLFRECFEAITALTPTNATQAQTKVDNKTHAAAEAGEDDEWEIVSVSLGSESTSAASSPAAANPASSLLYLKSSEYSVLRALVAALSSLDPVSVTLFDEYFSRTTSTVFRSPFVSAMVSMSPALFSDERLESVYRSSVESMRREMEKQCKELNGSRAGFISRLLEGGLIPNPTEFVHFATSQTLEAQLVKSVEIVEEPATPMSPVLRVSNWSWSLNWTLHGEVYLRFLSGHLQRHAKDPIWCGRLLTEFTSNLRSTRITPTWAFEIFKLYMHHKPLQINMSIMPAGVREHIAEMSRRGELTQQGGKVEYAGLARLFPPELIRRAVAPEERWALLQSHLVPCSASDSSLAFTPVYFELCMAILGDLARKPDYREPISVLTVRMLKALSKREVFRMIFSPSTAAMASGEGTIPSPALSLNPFLTMMFPRSDLRLSHPVRQAWVEMHLAMLPPTASTAGVVGAGADQETQALLKEFAPGRSTEILWKTWLDSFTLRLTPTLAQTAQKASQALSQCSVRTPRSAITSYAGYTAILAGELLRAVRAARDYAAPTDVMASILGVVEILAPLTNEQAIVVLHPPVQPNSAAEDAPGVKSIRAVRGVCDQLVLEAVTVLQQRAFCFDMMSPRYATLAVNQVQPLLTRLSNPANLQRFPSLAPALLGFYRATLAASQIPEAVDRLGFVLVAPSAEDASKSGVTLGVQGASASQKTKWIFVKREYHTSVSALMMDKLGELCAAAKTYPSLVPVAEEAWKIVRPRYFKTNNGSSAASSSSSSSSSSSAESDSAKLLDLATFNAFLSACATVLPSVIAAREKPLLLPALVHHLRAPNSRFSAGSVAGVTQLEGWTSFLLSAVDQCGAEWPSRSTLLSTSVADISLPAVRECMEKACSDRDPQVRLQQYLSILRLSATASPSVSPLSSLHEWARSLDFVQRRTKNEAGLYRKEIYQLINDQIATKVAQSLTPPTTAPGTASTGSASAAAAAGPSALASVQLITESLSAILRDDVSKRDSVAKSLFQAIGRTLLSNAVSNASNRPPQLAVRRLWISCGITLDWLVLRTISGEDAVRRWVWPITGLTLSPAQSITEAQLDGPIKSAVVAGVKGGEGEFATLRQSVYRTGMHVNVAAQDVFTPEQAVDLLATSFLAAQQQQSGSEGGAASDASSASASASVSDSNASVARPFDFVVENGSFFPPAEAEGGRRAASAADGVAYESHTLKRVQALLAFCGPQWTAVPTLVRFFETVVSTVANPQLASNPLAAAQYQQTFTLFQSVRKLYPEGSAWYELPPLARACSVLFETAVARSNIAAAATLRPVWTEMQMHKGKISSMSSLSLSERGWLVARIVRLRGRHALPGSASMSKPARMAADKADSSERSATVLRDLLALSPSVFHHVWSALLAARDDIFSQYLGRTRAQLFGIFDSAATLDAATNTLQPSFDAAQGAAVHMVALESKDLSSLDARAMQTFTRLCLRNAMNQSLSATVRSAAITQFVESPATSHADVIALLKDLQTRVAFKIKSEKKAAAKGDESKQEESKSAAPADASNGMVVDDAADLLLESVILKVFSTDGTWFILAHLLSPDVIAHSPQRTTAAILTNLRLWAPIDRTVAVLRILLEPRRRHAITLFLHKQILRLLFECMDSNEQARALFQAEWAQRNEAATRMSADVVHEVVKMCVTVLNGGGASGTLASKSALAWSVVEDLVEDSAAREVDPATLLLLFVCWQPLSPSVDSTGHIASNARSLSVLIRSIQPPIKMLAGVEDPTSFGHFHGKLRAEGAASFAAGQQESAWLLQACKRFAALMHKLSTVSKHPYLRVLARFQQFAFSAAMSGLPDDEAIQQLERMMVDVCGGESGAAAVGGASASSASTTSAVAQYVGVELDAVTQYSLQVLPRLFAGLSLQVLTRSWLDQCKSEPQSSFVLFCQRQPGAVRLRESIGTMLQTLLHTPPIQAGRRMRASTAVAALLAQISQTGVPAPPASSAAAVRQSNPSPSWSLELAQVPFKDLLNYLRRDGAASSGLPSGVERAGGAGAGAAKEAATTPARPATPAETDGLSLFD